MKSIEIVIRPNNVGHDVDEGCSDQYGHNNHNIIMTGPGARQCDHFLHCDQLLVPGSDCGHRGAGGGSCVLVVSGITCYQVSLSLKCPAVTIRTNYWIRQQSDKCVKPRFKMGRCYR